MTNGRILAAVVAGVLVLGILVGAAGTVLLAGDRAAADDSWNYMHGGMGGYSGGHMMMRGGDSSWMFDEMREHMGLGGDE